MLRHFKVIPQPCGSYKLFLLRQAALLSTDALQAFIPVAALDWNCLSPSNSDNLKHLLKQRNTDNDLQKLFMLYRRFKEEKEPATKQAIAAELQKEGLKIPNSLHPALSTGANGPTVVGTFGVQKTSSVKMLEFEELGRKLNGYRDETLAHFFGTKGYVFKGPLAQMEQALIDYTVDSLLTYGFELMSVPDMLHPAIVEGMGMDTSGPATQVYMLDGHYGNVCLSGTSEMAFGAFFANKVFDVNQLPIKVTAASRCFRAEVSESGRERGLYRVHQFTKVEMFMVVPAEESTGGDSSDVLESASNKALDEILKIQTSLFSDLGLHCRILDMPANDLGNPAHRKFDMEAWMPGRQMYGEVSSCSNCTDFQTRRLNITCSHPFAKPDAILPIDCDIQSYLTSKSVDELRAEYHCKSFPHTVNGTACAIPRMMIAILETYQNPDGSISVPKPLQSYMKCDVICPPSNVPVVKWIKSQRPKY